MKIEVDQEHFHKMVEELAILRECKGLLTEILESGVVSFSNQDSWTEDILPRLIEVLRRCNKATKKGRAMSILRKGDYWIGDPCYVLKAAKGCE